MGGPRYGTKDRAKARAVYEKGDHNLVALSKKLDIGLRTLEKWAADEKWDRGKMIPIIEQRTHEKMLQAFVKKGIEPEHVVGVVKEMLEATRLAITPSNQQDQQGNKESGMAEIVPDHLARDKAITQYAKMTGAYATEKKEIEVKGWMVNVTGRLVALMNKYIPNDKREEFLSEVDSILGE